MSPRQVGINNRIYRHLNLIIGAEGYLGLDFDRGILTLNTDLNILWSKPEKVI